MALRSGACFRFILLLVTAIRINSSELDTTNDNDYLRVSSNQFNGNPLNYHSITPANSKQVARASEDVINHIGKPLVPLPAKQTTTKQPTLLYVQRPSTTGLPKAKYLYQGQSRQQSLDGRTKMARNGSYIEPTGGQFELQQLKQLQQHQQQSSLLREKHQQHLATHQPATIEPEIRRVTTTSALPVVTRHLNSIQQSLDVSPTKASPAMSSSSTTCKWMQLAEFQEVSYETGRMVFVDDTEQPCYILTMAAFVKLNDTLYFPLRNYRPHPRGSYKISLRYPASDGAIERLVLNCSMPELNPSARTSISLLPSQIVEGYSFNEEITILVECGYLKLRLSGDGSHISLNSISFYQNDDLNDEQHHWQDGGLQMDDSKFKKRAASGPANPEQFASKTPESILMMSSKLAAASTTTTTSMMLDEHQVFSSEPVHEAPLLSMPLISRYSCRNRIVLNGSNQVQFVLERFELQRLITNQQQSVLSSASSSAPLKTRQSFRRSNPRASSQFVTSEGDHQHQHHHHHRHNDHQAASRRESESAQEKVHSARLINTSPRIRRDTTILYKSPLLAVTRCPSPTSPTSPLNFMMDPDELRRNDSFDKILANRRIAAARSSATASGVVVIFQVTSVLDGSHVGLVNYILTLYLVKQILNCSTEIHI